MAISSSNPKSVEFAEIPFDKLAPTLVISPRINTDGTGFEVSVTLVADYWRYLPSGQVDLFTGEKFHYINNEVYLSVSNGDIDLGKAVQIIQNAIAEFMIVKGA